MAQRMMDLYPKDAEAYNQLATMKFATGAIEEAIPLQEDSIRLNPRDPFLHERYQRIGYAMLILDREQESIPWFKRSLASDPDMPQNESAKDYRGLAVAYASGGHAEEAKEALAEAARLDHFATARSDIQWFGSETAIVQTRHITRKSSGAPSFAIMPMRMPISAYHRTRSFGEALLDTPREGRRARALSGLMISRRFSLSRKPIVIDTLWISLGRSLPGANGLPGSGVGGTFSDATQARLERKITNMTNGDKSAPIVAVGWSSECFDGYNLALRLTALGYTKVYWYRGGHEAWEVNGLPEDKLIPQDW